MANQMTNQSDWMQSLTTAYPKFQAITNPEKAKSELGFAMQIFQGNTYLQKCEPQSILNAVVNVARTSITLNPVMRLAYLIPRKNKCVLEFSYMGLVAMLRDNGCIKSISAHIVYEDEEFDYDVAFNTIKHKPNFAKTEKEHNERETIGCYSRATLPNGEVVFEFMPMWEIDKVRSMSEGSGSKYSAWNTWRDEMIKKSVIKRHFKMLISGNPTEALATALKVENENNALSNNFTQTNQKATLMNAFQEETPQIESGNLFEEVEVKEESNAMEKSKASLDFQNTNLNEMTEEQIEMEMNKVADESGFGLFEEPKDSKPKK
tara:strand:+ start:5695 stop:6654 length:960 start_codon:yes stop_codon:yes gene_type:complete